MLNIKKLVLTLLFIGSGLAFGQVKMNLDQIIVEIK